MQNQDVKEIIKTLSLEEKASLVTGSDFWMGPELKRFGLTGCMFTDGPHGLRKQKEGADHLGINESLKATCFPTACLSACSFDPELLYEMGEALGDKCIREDVAVILGPGINIKRNPLCGRNFEYFSEDPLVAGEMGTAFVKGVQSKGVGTSVKHFAVNSQETERMVSDSRVDQRALHEIYLSAFQKVVQEAKPDTVMCSYNKINGTYASENYWLLTKLLRETWGYEGLVISDWGAVGNKCKSLQAGLDLEMPGVGTDTVKLLVNAVKRGKIKETVLDQSAERILRFLIKALGNEMKSIRSDQEDHLLAEKIAVKSAVLLQNNENILPLSSTKKVAFIGKMAKQMRYQGAGSSRINPVQLDQPYDIAVLKGIPFVYADGYSLDGNAKDQELIDEAVKTAKECENVVIFAGLPDAYESEGFDREQYEIPEEQIVLIEAVAEANPNTVVVLQCGSPVDTSWRKKVKGILLMYLAGEAGGTATMELLFGEAVPGGKLAESWLEQSSDSASAAYYPGLHKCAEYREGIYVGYRYLDKAEIAPAFPFGFGLSYTTFQLGEMKITSDKDQYRIHLTVSNTGDREGSEVVQIYLSKKDSRIYRAQKELKAFQKINLKPGEEKEIEIDLDKQAFMYFNDACDAWCLEGGSYLIQAGTSSRDIIHTKEIELLGDGKETGLLPKMKELDEYMKPGYPFAASLGQFESLLGYTIQEEHNRKEPFTINSTLGDIRDTFIGKKIFQSSEEMKKKYQNDPGMVKMIENSMTSTPIRSLRMSKGLSWEQAQGMADLANKKYLRGLFRLIFRK